MTRRGLIRKLDAIFSQWIRRRAADHAGYVECFTCRKSNLWGEMHAGHFALRTHMATRWEPLNVHPQCPYCNTFRFGEQFRYSKRLDEVYGPGTADSVLAASETECKWTAEELEAEISKYTQKLKDLL